MHYLTMDLPHLCFGGDIYERNTYLLSSHYNSNLPHYYQISEQIQTKVLCPHLIPLSLSLPNSAMHSTSSVFGA